LNWLFKQTKEAYANDKIFEPDEEIRLKFATGRDIVKKLQVYNLSDTSEDIKGIAFERFLGVPSGGNRAILYAPYHR